MGEDLALWFVPQFLAEGLFFRPVYSLFGEVLIRFGSFGPKASTDDTFDRTPLACPDRQINFEHCQAQGESPLSHICQRVLLGRFRKSNLCWDEMMTMNWIWPFYISVKYNPGTSSNWQYAKAIFFTTIIAIPVPLSRLEWSNLPKSRASESNWVGW